MSISLDWLTIAERRGLVQPQAPALDCSEGEFQRDVVRLATARGWKSHHHYDARKSSPGWFDLVLAKLGRVVFVELKSESGTQTKEQLEWFTLFVSAGMEVYCWRPEDWSSIVTVLQ